MMVPGRITIGIDPGRAGGIVALGPDGQVLEAAPMPYLLRGSAKGTIDLEELRVVLNKYSDLAYTASRRARFGELAAFLNRSKDLLERAEIHEKLSRLAGEILSTPLTTCKIFLEEQQVMTGGGKSDGARAAFKAGKLFGLLEGVIVGLGIPREDVRPKAWQGYFGLSSSEFSGVDRKRYHIIEAQKQFPGMEFSDKDGLADAALIAKYGMSRP